jgi:hypothetical protein
MTTISGIISGHPHTTPTIDCINSFTLSISAHSILVSAALAKDKRIFEKRKVEVTRIVETSAMGKTPRSTNENDADSDVEGALPLQFIFL